MASCPDDVLSDHWRYPQSCTTLMHAAYSNNEEVLRIICDRLKQEVDLVEYISIKGGLLGWTVLHWWARGGWGAAALIFIVKACADINSRDDKGRTVLSYAIELDDEVKFRLLLEAGADIHMRNINGWTASTIVLENNGWTALHLSANRGHGAIVRILIEVRVDLNVKDETGRTALYIAAEKGDECICRLLLEAGADINATTKHGQSALYVSAERGHDANVRLLVESGADIHVNASHVTPLEIAVRRHCTDIANFLLDCMKNDLANTLNRCTDDFLLNNVVTQETGPSKNGFIIILQPNMFYLLCRRLVVYIERYSKRDPILSNGHGYFNSADVALPVLSTYIAFQDALFTQEFILHLFQSDAFHLLSDIDPFTFGRIHNKFDSLCSSFPLLGNDKHKHRSVIEVVTLDFGRRYPLDVLSRWPFHFLLKYVSTQDSASPGNDFLVIIQPVMFTQLSTRLVKEISNYLKEQNTTSLRCLSSYIVFNDVSFAQVFLRHLQDTGKLHLLFTPVLCDTWRSTFIFLATANGQDMLIKEIFTTYKGVVQKFPGFHDHLNRVLYAACHSGSVAAVSALLAAGAQADYRTAPRPGFVKYGWCDDTPTCTTLMHTAYSSNVEVLRLICDRLQQRVDLTVYIGIRDAYGFTALHWWARGEHKQDALQFILKTGADVNLQDDTGCTVLYHAAKCGDETISRLLLKAGADVNLQDDAGRTVLYSAAERGDETISRLLLEAGADANMTNNAGRTALYVSAERGHGATLRLLVESGADIHICASDVTPMEIAVYNCYSGVADFLLDCMNKDITNTLNRCSDTFLLKRVFTRESSRCNSSCVIILQHEMFQLLCERLVVFIQRHMKKDNFIFLSPREHHQSLILLSFYEVLHDAAFTEVFLQHLIQTDTFHLLSEIPSVTMRRLQNTPDSLCRSFPLLSDDKYMHRSILDVVTLDLGRRNPSDVVRRWSVQFLLKYAFTKESAPLNNDFIIILQPVVFVQLSSRLAAEITNCVNDENAGELRSMSSYGIFRDDAFTTVFLLHLQNIDAFHLLFTSGSSDNRHPTFMFLSAVMGQDVLIREVFSTYLRDVRRLPGFDTHLNRILYASCNSGCIVAVRALLAAGAEAEHGTAYAPDAVRRGWGGNTQTCTTLMHAAYSSNVEVLRLICGRLQQKVDMLEYINIRDSEGRTAIHWWAKCETGADALKFILKIGADINLKDTTGHTVLHRAVERGDKSITQLLVEAGADLNIRDSGRIPLDCALQYCNNDTADYLLDCMQKDLENTLNKCSNEFLLRRVFTQQTGPPVKRHAIIQQSRPPVKRHDIILHPEMFSLMCARLVVIIDRYLNKDNAMLPEECRVNSEVKLNDESPDTSLRVLSMHPVLEDSTFTDVLKENLQKIDALKPLLTSVSFDKQHPECIFRAGRFYQLLQDVLALQEYNTQCLS